MRDAFSICSQPSVFQEVPSLCTDRSARSITAVQHLEVSSDEVQLQNVFNFTGEMLSSTLSKGLGGFACAVSDPNAEDCPLVFISRGFEDLTGYPAEFACGRSCRFLQPISKVINDACSHRPEPKSV